MMPVPAQNSCLREYVSRKKGQYILPALESNYPDCYHQLYGVLQSMPENSGLIMYSALMLPSIQTKRNKIYELGQKQRVQFAFVMENLETREIEEIENELKIYELKSFSQPINVFLDKVGNYK